MTELAKLLAFMSPWDRQATLRRYERRFDAAEDEDELIERLGTPTKVAVMLADGYVSSPPPADGGLPEIGEFFEDEAEQLSLEEFSPAAEEAPEAEDAAVPARKGAGPVYWIFAALIGLPVAAALLCPGVPFLACGVSLIAAAVRGVPGLLGAFNLISDKLLLLGVGAAMAALGLLLAWLGIWLSIALCRLWILGVLRRGGVRPGGNVAPAILARAWKAVVLVVLALLALGVLLGGAGWLTGASLSRIEAVLRQAYEQLRLQNRQLEETLAQYMRYF